MRYQWKIETSPSDGAGTDARVWLSLLGDRGKSSEYELADPDTFNDFEAGQINQGFIDTIDVGGLYAGTLRQDGSGAAPDWRPSWIRITNEADGRVWFAAVGKELKADVPFVLKFQLESAGRNAPPPAPPPPPPGALGTPTADDIRSYLAGYEAGKADPLVAPDGRYGRWYQLGMEDAQQGRPARFTRTGSPPPGVRPGNVLYLELYFMSTITRRGVPYDEVVRWTRIGPFFAQFFDWELLGLAPGQSRDGFRLSGPNGPIARYVADLAAKGEISPNPRTYGLTAFVATRGKRNVRFVSRRELEQIGVLADYPELATRT